MRDETAGVEASGVKPRDPIEIHYTLSARSQNNGMIPERIAIIGAGRLGGALSVALAREGFEIAAVVTRERTHARRVARLVSTVTSKNQKDGRALLPSPLPLRVDELGKLPSCDLILIATPDDALASVAEKLAGEFAHRQADESAARNSAVKRTRNKMRMPVVLHTSGALDSTVLTPLAQLGCATGSLHPLVAVSGHTTQNFDGVFFCLEGASGAIKVARKLVRALGGKFFQIETKDKPLYHAAAVMAAGHLVALHSVACELVERCGVSEPEARRMLARLSQSALANLDTNTHARAVTGSFARGDASTISKHLDRLKSKKLAAAKSIYIALGMRSLELVAQNHQLDPKLIRQIAGELKKHK